MTEKGKRWLCSHLRHPKVERAGAAGAFGTPKIEIHRTHGAR
jgi:hypothetical protein